MARKLTPQQVYEDLLKRHEPALAEAFLRAVRDLKTNADRQRFLAALSGGDVEGAIRALGLSQEAFEPFLDRFRDAFMEAGRTEAARLSRPAVPMIFSGRTARTETWLRDYSATLVRQIVDDQRASLRTALVNGLNARRNPRTLMTDIVGVTNRVTGQREGGIIGLTKVQAGYVAEARSQLASGDPAQLRAYLTRSRRDKRYDRSVAKALRDGTQIPAEIQRKAVQAYQRGLLALRGETVARTETMTALSEGQYEAVRQAVESGAITANQVRRVWRATADGRTRETHRAMNGDSVGLNEAFRSPSGASIRFPGDPRAPAAERIQCRCYVENRIDYFANRR